MVQDRLFRITRDYQVSVNPTTNIPRTLAQAVWMIVWILIAVLQLLVQKHVTENKAFCVVVGLLPFIVSSIHVLGYRSKVKPYIQYFKYPISPMKYYLTKSLATIFLVIFMCVLGFLSCVCVSRLDGHIEYRVLLGLYFVALSGSVITAWLISEHLLEMVYRRMDVG